MSIWLERGASATQPRNLGPRRPATLSAHNVTYIQIVHTRAQAPGSGSAVLSITRRSTKLECTPVTPGMRVMRSSSSAW